MNELIPQERIKPGVGFQVINAYDRDGNYLRQVRHYGTEIEARDYVASLATHR